MGHIGRVLRASAPCKSVCDHAGLRVLMYGEVKRTFQRGRLKSVSLAAHGSSTGVVGTEVTQLVALVLHQLELLPTVRRKALPCT